MAYSMVDAPTLSTCEVRRSIWLLTGDQPSWRVAAAVRRLIQQPDDIDKISRRCGGWAL